MGTSLIQRRGEACVVVGWDTNDYEAMEQTLEGLTAYIPNMSIEEVPRRYQRHTVGVSGSLSQLLHRVARAVVCYCE
jgi:hypothetical protein